MARQVSPQHPSKPASQVNAGEVISWFETGESPSGRTWRHVAYWWVLAVEEDQDPCGPNVAFKVCLGNARTGQAQRLVLPADALVNFSWRGVRCYV